MSVVAARTRWRLGFHPENVSTTHVGRERALHNDAPKRVNDAQKRRRRRLRPSRNKASPEATPLVVLPYRLPPSWTTGHVGHNAHGQGLHAAPQSTSFLGRRPSFHATQVPGPAGRRGSCIRAGSSAISSVSISTPCNCAPEPGLAVPPSPSRAPPPPLQATAAALQHHRLQPASTPPTPTRRHLGPPARSPPPLLSSPPRGGHPPN